MKKCNVTLDMFETFPAEFNPLSDGDIRPANDVGRLALEVYCWADATFPHRTDSSMFLKMYSEIAELIRSDGEPLELADLFILLMDYAVRKDIDITDAVRRKLEINRQRTWKVGADGTMSHEPQGVNHG